MRIIERFGGLDRGLDRVALEYSRWLGWVGGVESNVEAVPWPVEVDRGGAVEGSGLAGSAGRAGGGVAGARTGRAIDPFASRPRRLKVSFCPGHREVVKIGSLKNARSQKDLR